MLVPQAYKRGGPTTQSYSQSAPFGFFYSVSWGINEGSWGYWWEAGHCNLSIMAKESTEEQKIFIVLVQYGVRAEWWVPTCLLSPLKWALLNIPYVRDLQHRQSKSIYLSAWIMYPTWWIMLKPLRQRGVTVMSQGSGCVSASTLLFRTLSQ